MRRDALVSLARVGADTSVVLAALQRGAKDEEPAVRRTAAQLLGEMSSAAPAALPTLLGLLDDRDERVRVQAVRVLQRMRPLPEDAERALAAHESGERRRPHEEASHAAGPGR